MNSTIVITIDTNSLEEQDILVAKLSDAGFDAFEQNSQSLAAYIEESAYACLDPSVLKGIRYTMSEIKPQNWNAEWESSFEPVLIGDFCGIRAAFHEPIPTVTYEIIITPKMSFGTGHHATTWLMIDQMSHMNIKGKSVLDFGTGTGVLAILATKMGAESVVAVDNDDWSIENARENFVSNGAAGIRLFKSDNLTEFSAFHLILANINKHVLVSQMPVITQHLLPGGVVLFSGLLRGDRDEMVTIATANRLTLLNQTGRDNWISLAFCWQA